MLRSFRYCLKRRKKWKKIEGEAEERRPLGGHRHGANPRRLRPNRRNLFHISSRLLLLFFFGSTKKVSGEEEKGYGNKKSETWSTKNVIATFRKKHKDWGTWCPRHLRKIYRLRNLYVSLCVALDASTHEHLWGDERCINVSERDDTDEMICLGQRGADSVGVAGDNFQVLWLPRNSPSTLCDDHLGADLVELRPQIVVLELHLGVGQRESRRHGRHLARRKQRWIRIWKKIEKKNPL